MLKTLLCLYNLRPSCIINIYIKCMSTKTKGHSSSSPTSIFKDGLAKAIGSNPMGAIRKNKKAIYLPEDRLKNDKSMSQQNNSKIFSLLESSPLLTQDPTRKDVSLKTTNLDSVCRANDYYKIMAATKSNTDEEFDYDKYQEDCLAESKRLKGFRKWNNTSLGQNFGTKQANSSMFTLLSFNILAQNLLESHKFLYRTSDPRALTWTHRVQKILEEIISYNAEIICLQELQQEHISYLTKALMPLNYKYVYKKRTMEHKDGSAIFYKSNLFTMVDYKLIEYYQPNVEVLNRDNVGIVIKLKINEGQFANNATDSDIVVATTHLLYNPKRSDVRLAQAQLMVAELDKMAYMGRDENGLPQYLPIILTGDFNLQPHTPVYTFLTRGILQYSNLTYRQLEPIQSRNDPRQCTLLPPHVGINDNCQYIDVVKRRLNMNPAGALDNRDTITDSGLLIHSLNLTSSYYHMVNKSKAQASTYQNEWITVDYIFYSHGSNDGNVSGGNKVGNLKLLSRLELPTISECDFMGPIPNLVFGSDHLLLAAKFLYNR